MAFQEPEWDATAECASKAPPVYLPACGICAVIAPPVIERILTPACVQTGSQTTYETHFGGSQYIPVTSTAPAMPGDLVVLWCSGLGPTNPPTPAGAIVTNASPTATLPVVAVGGMQVPVVSSVMTTGTVGLYQITIQFPANVPAGAPAVQASIAGASTQSGLTLFVGNQ